MKAFPPNSAILENFDIHGVSKNLQILSSIKNFPMNCLQIFIIDCLQANTILPFLLTLVVVYLSHMMGEAVESLLRTFTREKRTSLLETALLPSLPSQMK